MCVREREREREKMAAAAALNSFNRRPSKNNILVDSNLSTRAVVVVVVTVVAFHNIYK